MISVLTFLILILFLFAGFLFFIQRERRSRLLLERKFSDINSELQSVFVRLEEERARLETTFSGMVEGVLLTDGRGDIVHVNPSFREIFELKGKVEGRSALEVLSSVACDDAIREVIRKGGTVEREIVFEKPRRRVLQVYFSPVVRDGKLSGVVSVFHDLTEIRRLEEIRRDFIANLSHEVKTPLTAIRGYAETLLDECREDSTDPPHPPEFRKQVEIIFRHATELNHLMENLLNLSRIESGREEVVLEKIDLKTFVDQIFERFQSQARVKGIELINEAGRETPELKADPGKLNQILSNLIDNAIKYIPNSSDVGQIWVRATVKDEGGPAEKSEKGDRHLSGASPLFVCIEVEDTGPGIPEADRQRIFERFYRLDKARSRETGGAGLGLAIVKHLVELHGGRIRVESTPGRGSKFILSFP